MARIIVHKAGVFNVYCTISDNAIFTTGIKEEDLRIFWFIENGRNGLGYLDRMIEDAKTNGSSNRTSLAKTIASNRAGFKERKLSLKEFVEKFLTIPENYNPYSLDAPFQNYYEYALS